MFLLEQEIKAIQEYIKHLPGRHDQRTHGNRFGGGSGSTRTLVHHGGGAAGHNVIRDANGDITGVRIRGKKPTVKPVKPADIVPVPPAHQTASGKKMSEEDLANSVTVKDMLSHGGRSSMINGGDDTLAHLYKEQGFDGKPDLVSEDALNAAIAGGEREFFRAVRDDSHGTYTEAFQKGDYHAGYGIYGNGTYMAYSKDASRPQDALTEAYNYGDTSVHVSLKKDAKIGNYRQIKDEADTLARDTQSSLNALRSSFSHTRNPAKKQALQEEMDKKSALMTIYQDEGRYAVSQGYDGYDISVSRGTAGDSGGAGYFVLLNRTALRVSTKTGKKGRSW